VTGPTAQQQSSPADGGKPAGYSSLTDPVRNPLRTAARSEGIVLDPIYTGRAVAGLAEAVREGEKPMRRL
jgi:1-aminocyclopropane-1-carboxylate deaminase/D-cysteine desulfhydrase-like pyridoxal-dependent ACC family enzyme